MRSAVAYRPIIGLFVHSVTHSAFMLSRSSPWGFAIVAVCGEFSFGRSVAPFASPGPPLRRRLSSL